MILNRLTPIYAVSLILALIIGFLSAFNTKILFIIIGLILYLILVLAFENEEKVKRFLPIFLMLILFQDTIKNNTDIYLPMASPFISYIDEMWLLVCLSALIVKFLKGKPIKGRSIIIVILSVLVFGFISSALNNVPFIISLSGAVLLLKGLLYLFVFCNISFNKRDIKRFEKWISYIAVTVLIFGVIDLFFYQQLREFLHTNYVYNSRVAGIVSVSSLFVHPNLFGWFTAYVGIYAITKYKIYGNNKAMIAAIIFFSFSVLSLRFKSILGIILVCVILYLLMNRKKALAYFIPFSLLFSLLYIALGSSFIELLNLTVNRYINIDMFDSARKALYMVSFWIAESHFPFGVGFGRFGGFVARDNYSPVYYEYGLNNIYGLSPENPMFATDTYFPNLLGELGIVGAFIFILMIVLTIIRLLKNYKFVERNYAKHIVFFSGLVLVEALAESLGEPVFNSSPQNIYIFIAVGIGISLLGERTNDNKG